MMEQIPNIELFGTIFEPIHSPEYNQYCKEVGLVLSYVGGKYIHYIEPEGGSCTIVHHPMFDGKQEVPYRLNNNYKDPREVEREFWKKEFEAGNIKLIHLDDESIKDNKQQELKTTKEEIK